MRKVTVDSKRPMADVLPRKNEDVLLLRNGHPVALVVPFDDDDLEWYALERDPAFIESIRRAREQVARGETIPQEEVWASFKPAGAKELEEDLTDSQGAVGVADAEEFAPASAGLYAIFVDQAASLPEPFSSCLARDGSKLIYIGVATKSIRKRLIDQDFRCQQPSSFFRSLGAALGFTPTPGSLAARKNKQNFSFSPADKRSIMKWIECHLRVKWLESGLAKAELQRAERRLIETRKPVFNLSGNGNGVATLQGLRKRCRIIATGE